MFMETPDLPHQSIPAGHFSLEEIQQFQSHEGQELAGIDYYLWLDTGAGDAAPAYQFLFALELRFAAGASLILTTDEDHGDLRITDSAALIKTASALFQLHGRPVIQRLSRDQHSLWQALIGRELAAIRLTRTEEGLYQNDALLLDFGTTGIIIARDAQGIVLMTND